jgi:hypothetical protein
VGRLFHRVLIGTALRVAVLGVLGGCVTVAPPTEVVSLRAGSLPEEPGLPPPGTTWRLDPAELQALSPAPYVAPPPLMLPYPVPGVAAPPPVPEPYLYVPPLPLFYFGLGYTWDSHRHSHRSHRHWRGLRERHR